MVMNKEEVKKIILRDMKFDFIISIIAGILFLIVVFVILISGVNQINLLHLSVILIILIVWFNFYLIAKRDLNILEAKQ